MNQGSESSYIIPARYRKMENMHILFWLVKDLSWCMIWKVLGMVMIAPTLVISIIIAWRTRHIKSELAHNLAVSFWISANSYWMISEFYGFDENTVWQGWEGRHIALIPFFIGIAILAYYYLVQRRRHPKTATVSM